MQFILLNFKKLTNFANLFTATDLKKEVYLYKHNNLLLFLLFINLINNKIQNN
jgi:hypothetical protein